MIHARIQEFSSGGGGGGSRSICHMKKSSDNGFYLIFLVLNLFYRSLVVTFKKNYYLQRFQWGGIFSRGGGSNFLQGGPIVQLLFPNRNPYNL